MNRQEKTDDINLYRDKSTHALLNNNAEEYNLYKTKREREKCILNALSEIDTLKDNMAEIKHMLIKLIGSGR
jgi:hypothetical protein